jgi:Fe-Mn family superoxide dismutase
MAFTLPALGYDYDALGNAISADIMRLHHDNHHLTYVDKLNAALATAPGFDDISVEQLIGHLDTLPETIRIAVRNNGGGHYNHSLFWKFMSPNGGGEPKGSLKDAIVQKYGSFQAFVDQFSDQALTVFGSGWVWLQPDLSFVKSPLQDSPIMNGQPEPILGLDLWEHAYYLDYTYKRADYVKAWWDVVDWDFVASRYAV